MALPLCDQLRYLDETAPSFEPRVLNGDQYQGMQWRLLRVTDPQRALPDADRPEPVRAPVAPVIVAIGTREVLLNDMVEFEVIAFTSDGRRVCEMSGSTTGWQRIKLTNGHVILERASLLGWRLGSYCFNQIVHWAKRHCPERKVLPIYLLASDANGVNGPRRNAFYEKFGLQFAYKDVNGVADAAGESLPIRVGDLIELTPDAFPNILELDMLHVLGAATHWLPQAQKRVIDLRGINAEQRREQSRRADAFLSWIRCPTWLAYLLVLGAGAMVMWIWCLR